MFGWLNRRKRIRRDDDLRDRMEKTIEEKHKVSLEALEQLRQYKIDRRNQMLPVDMDRRRA